MKSIIAWGELELSKMRLKFGAYVLSTAFIMLLIFLFSAQDANASQKLSDGILYEILSLLRAQELMERFGMPIRKLAHFCLYFALGLSSLMMFLQGGKLGYTISKAPAPLSAFMFGAVYAISDEIHQHYVPGRSMQFTDVLLDCAGVLTAILIFTAIKKLCTQAGRGREET